jgi:hypothetical protein
MAVVVVFALSVASGGALQVSAAPQAAVTPVGVKSPTSGDSSNVVRFFDGEALTADTTRCRDLGEYLVADVEFVVDQGTTNTTTVSLLHTNDTDLGVYATGQTVVSANTADANDLNRFDLYGRYTCVKIDVANTNPITWTVTMLARQ